MKTKVNDFKYHGGELLAFHAGNEDSISSGDTTKSLVSFNFTENAQKAFC